MLCNRINTRQATLHVRLDAHTPHATHPPGEGGIKRLAKQIDAAADAVHESLSERLTPAVQATLALLGELEALAQCEPWASKLGLDVRRQHPRLCCCRWWCFTMPAVLPTNQHMSPSTPALTH